MRLGRRQRVARTSCPACGKTLDAVIPIDGDHKPKPGDVTICAFGCGALLTFTGSGLRVLDATAQRQLSDDVRQVLATLSDLSRQVRRVAP